jgi:hypothetical protein
MPLIEPFPEPAWMTILAVDAMYFDAAKRAQKRALSSTKAIDRAEERAASLRGRIASANARRDEGQIDDSEHYNLLEPLAIQMEGAEYRVGAAYGPFLQHLATVQVFAAASLEAHINIRAEALLGGRIWTAFDRLPLDGKWLLLPLARGLPGFDPGREPFQSFDRLIKARNNLMHYRVRKEPWRGADVPPEFLGALGLSLEAAEKALTAVREMVSELAKQLGEKEPWWLDAEDTSFFHLETGDD